jgi:teichuronic acid biosynthesis glycosyltransferase TuaC
MHIHWLHNYFNRSVGTFMWDIYDRLERNLPGSVSEHAIPVLRKPLHLWASFRHKITGNDSFDILHGQCGSFVGLRTAVTSAAPCKILSFRGSDIYWRHGGFKETFTGLLRMWLSWFSALQMTAVIVMSVSMQSTVKRWLWLKRKPVHVIPDPIHAMYWPKEMYDIYALLEEQPWTVLIANLYPDSTVKRTRIIVDAVKLCQESGLNVKLISLSGDSREEVQSSLKKADCVAISSTHEGWPNIIKEGMMCSCTFIATDVSDLAFYAGPDSDNFIVLPHAVDFAIAMVDCVAIATMKEHHFRSSLIQFHPDVAAMKHNIVYQYYMRCN